jgi:hypothetical protein
MKYIYRLYHRLIFFAIIVCIQFNELHITLHYTTHHTPTYRIIRNSARALLDPDSITYYLYMRTGYENIQLGDRVFATVEPVVVRTLYDSVCVV